MLIRIAKSFMIGMIVLMLLSLATSVFAVSSDNAIDNEQMVNPMSISNETENVVATNESTNTFESTTNTNSFENNTNTNSSENTTSDNTFDDTVDDTTPTSYANYTGVPDSSASVSSYVPSSELGLSDILNILLIVVGVLLILLAIAILIKLKR